MAKLPPVEIEIVLLLAVIGQRLARDLSSGNAAAVGEDRKEQRIHGPSFLKDVEHFLRALVHERDGASLNADHLGRHCGACSLGRGEGNARPHGGLEKASAIEI